MKSKQGGKMVHYTQTNMLSKYIDIAHIAQVSSAAFTEQEIIAVNDILLSNGLHTVTLKNKKIGCQIIDTFLSLLNCYQYVYWLGLKGTTPAGTINLYDLLWHEGCLQDHASLYEVMATQFYPSCLVIEVSDALESQGWYKDFYMSLQENHLFDSIPVIRLEFMQ